MARSRLWHPRGLVQAAAGPDLRLHACAVGGCTEFAGGRAAYDALIDIECRLSTLIAEYSISTSRARLGVVNCSKHQRRQFPPAPQTLVRTIAGSRGKTLGLAAGCILGMPSSEGRVLRRALIVDATAPQFVSTRYWRINVLVMWHNRCTVHRGTRFDDLDLKRDVQRATVPDVAVSCAQEGARGRLRRATAAP